MSMCRPYPKFILSFLAVIFFTGLAEAGAVKIPGVDSDLYSVAVSPFDGNEVFAGSYDSVFKSVDGGKTFKRVFVIKGDYKSVNSIMFFNGSQRPEILIATDSGLYLSRGTGKVIRKLFRKQNEEEDYIRCLSVLREYPYVYLGTNNGLYAADIRTYDFQPVSGIPRDAKVNDIRVLPSNAVAAASSSGVYLKNSSSLEFKRVFVSNLSETSSGEEDTLRNVPQCIYSDAKRAGYVYLGTSSGVFVSKDSGKSWDSVNIPGLSGLSIRRIISAGMPSQAYLASNQGLYKADFSLGKLELVYQGMESQDIRDIALIDEDSLFAATSKGLYKVSAGGNSQDTSKGGNRLTSYFKNEPSYMDVQESALRVNEVHPEQIKKWRNRLKYRALFPTFRIDYDKTIQAGGTGSHFGEFAVGPRSWGYYLQWDIGDLIWNNYEDDIDTRSRLKTQTRLEILDDIRRIYFEREKLEIELANNPPDNPDKLLEKQLYLKELTAALDGYTNGYFSRRLKEMANGK